MNMPAFAKPLYATLCLVAVQSTAVWAVDTAAPASSTSASKSLNATNPHGGAVSPRASGVKPVEEAPIKVARATGANAYTVAEVIAKAAELKDKQVRVSGKVVKYNVGIMGKNWIHLQDGSGSATTGNHDILVTSTGQTKLGDIITASGVVHTDRDFGAGYVYKVLIEDAAIESK